MIDRTSASGAALAGPTSAITPRAPRDLLRSSGHRIKFAPPTSYVFRSRTVLARARSDAGLVSQFAMVHGDNCGAYGAKRVSYEQRQPCHTAVARCTPACLMQFDELRGVSRANSPRTNSRAVDDARGHRESTIHRRSPNHG